MRNPRESQYSNGAIPPDPEEANQLNALHGPIPQPSRLLKGTAAVLGLGTVVFLADGCARDDRPAEVRPTGAVPTQIRETPRPVQPTPTETPKLEPGWRVQTSTIFPIEMAYPLGWTVKSRYSAGSFVKNIEYFLNNEHPPGLSGLSTAGMSIMVQQANEWNTLDHYVRQRANFLEGGGVRGIQTWNRTVGGERAEAINYSYPDYGTFLRVGNDGHSLGINEIGGFGSSGSLYSLTDVLLLRNKQLLHIQFVAIPQVVEREYPTFQKMLDSVRFLQGK